MSWFNVIQSLGTLSSEGRLMLKPSLDLSARAISWGFRIEILIRMLLLMAETSGRDLDIRSS
jgi:hypothetical protein